MLSICMKIKGIIIAEPRRLVKQVFRPYLSLIKPLYRIAVEKYIGNYILNKYIGFYKYVYSEIFGFKPINNSIVPWPKAAPTG